MHHAWMDEVGNLVRKILSFFIPTVGPIHNCMVQMHGVHMLIRQVKKKQEMHSAR